MDPCFSLETAAFEMTSWTEGKGVEGSYSPPYSLRSMTGRLLSLSPEVWAWKRHWKESKAVVHFILSFPAFAKC